MKKVLFFLALIASVALVSAQDFNAVTYGRYTGNSTTDTIATQYGEDYVYWQVNRNDQYLYRVDVTLDEVSGSATVYVILQGSHDYVNWVELDTLANAAGTEATTADGTIFLTDMSTGVMWRYLRTRLLSTGTGATAASIWHYDYVIFRAVAKP
jgi:hypothetical protein